MGDQGNWIFIFGDGGRMSFHSVFRLYYRSLCYFAATITNNKEEAEDIITDLFVRICRKGIQFKTPAELKSFLYTSAKNAF